MGFKPASSGSVPLEDYPGLRSIPSVYMHQEDPTTVLKYAKARGFTAVTASDLIDAVDGTKTLPRKPFFLSFDDEPSQWVTVVDPALAAFGAKASGFISCGYPDGEVMGGGTDPFFYTNTQPCSWAQLQALKATGRWDFQNHSRTHVGFDGLTTAQRIAEWDFCQARLLAQLGVVPRAFCHPIDAATVASIQDAFNYPFRLVVIGPLGNLSATYAPQSHVNPVLQANRTRNRLVMWRDGSSTIQLERVIEAVGNRIPDMPLDDNTLGVWTVTGGVEGNGVNGVRFDLPDKSGTIDLRSNGGGAVAAVTAQRMAVRPGESLVFEYIRECGVGAGSYTIVLKEHDYTGAFLRDVTIENLTGVVVIAAHEAIYTPAADVHFVKVQLTITGAPGGSYATFQLPYLGTVTG
jgi:peptidoglycan/xylan/chitin deacetylase (PgdA/CDA1 family)